MYNDKKRRLGDTMLFREEMPRSCSYCTFGTKLENGNVLCIKKGIVRVEDSCRKFEYDPCKRLPLKEKSLDFSKYSEDDFTL